jgi:hypothetical protein
MQHTSRVEGYFDEQQHTALEVKVITARVEDNVTNKIGA